MAIALRPHSEELSAEVSAFNRRVHSSTNLTYVFPESPVSVWLPKIDGRSIFQEFFLALDDGTVRGAYILKHQPFLMGNETLSIGYYLPVSEGLFDRKYASLAAQLLIDCLRRQPLLYWLGVGGMEQPLPKMLKAARWTLWTIPFYFRVVRPRAFLHNIAYLRRTKLRKVALDFLAYSGLGLALRGYQALRTKTPRGISAELVPEFGKWADQIWLAGRSEYKVTAVRDAESLQILYRPEVPRSFIRLRVKDGSRDAGWAVCLNTRMERDESFGSMRLGSIVDCFARGDDAGKVVAAATSYLEAAGADLIVTNQSHRDWRAAMERAGYFSGPSRYLIALSPKLSQRLEPLEPKKDGFHITRGDGDGPIHL